MAPYIILFIFCLFLSVSIDSSKGMKKAFIVLFILVISLFSGLRFGVGTDYFNYVNYIEKISLGANTYMEPGFEWVVRLLSFSGLGSQSVFLLFSFFTVFFYCCYISRKSNLIGISLLSFVGLSIFYLATMGGIRQFFAISLFLFSFKYIDNKELYKFILMIIIAAFFHSSAVLMLPVYFIINKKIPIWIYCVSLFAVCFFSGYVVNFLNYIGFSGAYLNVGHFLNYGFNLKFVFVFVLLISLLYLRWRGVLIFSTKPESINMLAIACSISVLPIIFNEMPSKPFIRLTSYFTPVIIIIIGDLILLFSKDKRTKIFLYLIVCLLLMVAYFALLYFQGKEYSLVPYAINF